MANDFRLSKRARSSSSSPSDDSPSINVSPIGSVPVSSAKLPLTPPNQDTLTQFDQPPRSSILTALHVIAQEREALANIERIYSMDIDARSSMERVVEEVATTVANGSKLVICGVGKSGKIGQKIVATMNSLGVHSSFLHPTEALHGDLGMIRPDDTVLVISYSGKTKELLHLLPHIPRQAVLVAMTQHMNPADCPILTSATNHTKILLPSPIHRSEEDCFGVSAPTTSTTVALALGDALSLAAARRIYDIQGKRPQDVFRAHHPGGAIGAAYADSIARQQQQQQPQPQPQLQPNAYRSPVSEAEPSLSPTAIMSSVLSSDNDENLPQDLTCRDLLSNPLV